MNLVFGSRVLSGAGMIDADHEVEFGGQVDEGHGMTRDALQQQRIRESAMFLLKLREERHVSLVAVSDIISECRHQCERTASHVLSSVRSKLLQHPDFFENIHTSLAKENAHIRDAQNRVYAHSISPQIYPIVRVYTPSTMRNSAPVRGLQDRAENHYS